MTSPFVVAVPSKGRLQENAEAFFSRAGLTLTKAGGARDYRGTIAGLDNVEIAYLSASEIAANLARGAVHLGITGEDLLRENIVDTDKRVALIEGLGFGRASTLLGEHEQPGNNADDDGEGEEHLPQHVGHRRAVAGRGGRGLQIDQRECQPD